MSLVSVKGGNRCYSCEKVEGVETGEIIEIASIHAGLTHIAENMVGYGKRLGEYPALSANSFNTFVYLRFQFLVSVLVPVSMDRSAKNPGLIKKCEVNKPFCVKHLRVKPRTSLYA